MFSLRSSRAVVDGDLRPATLWIDRGRIAAVDLAAGGSAHTLDVGDLVVMPGVVDVHVHVNEPGRTDWEGFETAGRAAAAGGVTTMVVMPLNCTPAATTAEALVAEAEAGRRSCRVDFGLWGGLIAGNAPELVRMRAAGALGFKCFLVHAGVDDFPNVSDTDLEQAGPILAGMAGPDGQPGTVPLLVHAEDEAALARAKDTSGLTARPRSYAAYLASRPPESEFLAVERMVALCQRHRSRVHIVHVSAGESLAIIAAARREGLPLSAETCPHYLCFAAEDIADGATEFKCAPPIRVRDHRTRLWDGLSDGTLSLIASDHSPCPPELKRRETGDFAAAWGGISSLELTLPAVWSQSHRRGSDLPTVSRWLSAAPAELAGLHHRKGRLAVGMDADLIVFDPDAEWAVDASQLQHRHKLTPYHGRRVRGRVEASMLRGQWVWSRPETVIRAAQPASAPPMPDGFTSEITGQWLTANRQQ